MNNKVLFNLDYVNRFILKDNNGYNLTQLVYYFGFFFSDGYKKENRAKVVAVCEEYWKLCGRSLNWMTNPRSHRWEKVSADYNLQNWLSAYPERDYAWQMVFHSGQVKYESPQYCIDGIGNSTVTHNTSHLYLCVPVAWFFEHSKQHPITLYLRWAEILNARHGTSGIGVFPAYEMQKRGQTHGITQALSRYFPGIEICDSLQSVSAGTGVLSPNWLNLLDNNYVDELGGCESLLKNIQGTHAQIHKYNGGVIISASEYPQLCEGCEPLTVPEDYRVVSKILKPIRSRHLFGFWGVETEHSLEWRSRMD